MTIPSTGEATSGIRTLSRTPDQMTACTPSEMIARPSRPPISAWLDELGMPSRHVIRFQVIAPIRAAATMTWPAASGGLRRARRDRDGDRRAGQRPDEIGRRRHEDRLLRLERPGRDRGRDRVRGVVEAVDVVEDDGQHDDDEERKVRSATAGRLAGRSAAGGVRRYPSRMRLSQLFFASLRDDPTDAEMASHRLLVRAGYVRQLGSGIYSLLPLGKRVNDRVEQIIREGRTGSARRRWRCRSSIRRRSGRRAAATSRSARSCSGSRIAPSGTWSWRSPTRRSSRSSSATSSRATASCR